MTKSEYFQACAGHDWYYAFSDDMRVYRAGESVKSRLRAEANSDPEKKAIFDAWHDYHFSGAPFGSEKAPKPVPEDFDL